MPQAATITTHTYRPGDPYQHITEIRDWLETLTVFLEDLDHRFRASTLPEHRFAPQWTPTCVLEGLGFDLPLYGLPVNRPDLLRIEQRLANLGVQLVVLRVPSARVLSQCVLSTKRHRGPKWTRYLERFGVSNHEQARHLETRQQLLLEWASSSPLPLHILDTAQADWDAYARQIVDLVNQPP
jgi:hypothetical protein